MASLPLRAVYAPVPENEQGKDLTLSLRAGISHDSNLFGAASDEVGSWIFTFAPRAVYNRSLTDQTFLAASYGLTLDRFDNRPGDKLLDSHDANFRLAHAFSRSTTLDVNESFVISRNPESLLAGIPLNPDQSFTRNQIDGRLTTPLNAKATAMFKARSVYFKYRNELLGRNLDRIENLYGVAADYAFLPEVKAVAEYRHLDVFYRKLGESKNKSSEFVMGGVDYDLAQKVSISTRLGAEWRRREAEADTTSPYAEVSSKFDYAPKSFLIGGYGYALEETSDTVRFNDTRVHRFFVNLQHSLTALVVASGSLSYEPSVLQGRRGSPNVAENSVRAGCALSYLPTKNWILSVSYDYDRVRSDDPQRNLYRERAGLNAIYTF